MTASNRVGSPTDRVGSLVGNERRSPPFALRAENSFRCPRRNRYDKSSRRQRIGASLVSHLVPEACVSHEEEHSWIRAAQAGDTRAYAALVDRYWPRVQRWLTGLTQDIQAAEDVTQDVFLKAWNGLPRFTAGS